MTDHQYQGAQNYVFFPGMDELLEPGEREKLTAQWVRTLIDMHALTETIADQMDPDERKKYGTIIWASVGGERVNSGGEVEQAFDEITEPWKSGKGILQARARERRKAAGWKTGSRRDYRIDPDGRTGPKHSSQSYGPFTLPGAERSRGMWNGVLIDGVKFTK